MSGRPSRNNPPVHVGSHGAVRIRNGGVHFLLFQCLLLVSMVSQGLASAETTTSQSTSQSQFFNFEIAKRVKDNLQFYLGQSETALDLVLNARKNKLFDYDMTAPDRDMFFRFLSSYPESILPSKLANCGLEDGTHMGLWDGYSYYREPGNSGYTIGEDSNNRTIGEDSINYKHFKACLHWENGTQYDCVMESGEIYVKYQCEEEQEEENINQQDFLPDRKTQVPGSVFDPSMVSDLEDPANTTSDAIAAAANDTEAINVNGPESRRILDVDTAEKKIINNDLDNDPEQCTPVYQPCSGDENGNTLCKQYTLVTVGEEGKDDVPRGHVSMTSYCIDATGGVTEEPGMALDYDGGDAMVDCVYYGSGDLVQGKMPTSETTGEPILDYAYCRGKSQAECSSTMFTGSFWSENYDSRNRPWYIETKQLLRPNWADPYPFAGYDGEFGITLNYPLFTTMDDGTGATRRFEGVCGVDYRLKDVNDFLVEAYKNTSTLIVIFEAEAPHRVIGSSTGTVPIRDGIHLSIDEFYDPMDSNGTPLDEVLVQAYWEQAYQNYPEGRLITVKISEEIDSKVYASQSTLYEYPGIEGLKWRVIIVSPGIRSDQDEILPGSGGTFALVIALATAGVLLCTFFCFLLYRKRTERAVIFGDWRFTCAFIAGCVLMNTSSYSYLGPTTDSTCLLRMWMFHLMFAITLSPLFVKVYRMHRLVGSGHSFLRTTFSNRKAASWTLPIIVIMILILIVSTFVFPPQAQEIIENNEGEELVVQRIVCASENPTMLIVRFTFEAILLLVGCILAYKTRHLKKGFGESKQLIFAMYNIALVMVIIGVVIGFVEMNASSKGLLLTIGVLWGTGFSAAAFVVPRMVQIKRQSQNSRGSSRTSGVTVPQSSLGAPNGVVANSGKNRVVANSGKSGNTVTENSQEPVEKSSLNSIGVEDVEDVEEVETPPSTVETPSAENAETAPSGEMEVETLQRSGFFSLPSTVQ